MKQILLITFLLIQFCTAFAGGKIRVGAERIDEYIPLLTGKNVAVVANQSSLVGSTHLVDTLLSLQVQLQRIFSPEHGFRGTADAGKAVENGKDIATGIDVVSLYGNHYKPSEVDLANIDIVLFDLQDVGARFYTYFSTMCYVLEACAGQEIPVIILDRPNPNGHYIDGPILESKYTSFVGRHPVPIVHGMTAAEYARMANEEGWLKDSIRCELSWVTCENYNHSTRYTLPIKPSPNLPNARAIEWYPTLALFEGINMSIGRGTDFPFQVVGHPTFPDFGFSFTPEPKPGAASNPRYKGQMCHGVDLRTDSLFIHDNALQLDLLLFAYKQYPDKPNFFKSFFLNLSGTAHLKKDIQSGKTAEEIRKSWQEGLENFQQMRQQYLLYDDSPIIVDQFGR